MQLLGWTSAKAVQLSGVGHQRRGVAVAGDKEGLLSMVFKSLIDLETNGPLLSKRQDNSDILRHLQSFITS